MKKIFTIICITFFLTACGDGVPMGVISRKKMEKVLWDVAQGGEFANGYIYYTHPDLNKVAVDNKLLDEILDINDVSRKKFNKSIEWYQEHPEILKVMLDSIQSKGRRLKMEAETKKMKEDSIRAKKAMAKITPDSLRRRDSIARKDSIARAAQIKKTEDSIARKRKVDSLANAKGIKPKRTRTKITKRPRR